MTSRWFLTSDWHAPFYEPRVFTSLLAELHRWKPTHVVLMGDIVDFYPLSKHLRSPARMHQSYHAKLRTAGEVLFPAGKP